MQRALFNHRCYVQLDLRDGRAGKGLGSLGPVAAGADGVKDQPLLAALREALAVHAVVEVPLVVGVCVDPVGFPGAEAAAAGAAGAAGTAGAAAGGGGSLGDGRQGLSRGNTVWNSRIQAAEGLFSCSQCFSPSTAP